jgi:hypothetical protein
MLARLLLFCVTLPWVITFALLRLLIALLRWPSRYRARNADVLRCAAGHPNNVMGRWTCSCGATYLGHVFGPCPICGMSAGWVRCERCDLAIRSPWKDS